MKEIEIPAGSLAVMSGLPGAGKSHILRESNLPQGVVQSSDELRRMLAGSATYFNEGGELVESPLSTLDALVWKTLEAVVDARLRAGLTTIVDATLVADDIPGSTGRSFFAKLAEKHGVPFKVIIVDTPYEQVLARNASRTAKVPVAAIERFRDGRPVQGKGSAHAQKAGGFQTSSRFPYEVVRGDARVRIVSPVRLDGIKWDVIGDVHGLLDDLKGLLEDLGYIQDSGGTYSHPDGRKLLFLGDVVDRGPKSLETLIFVRDLCDSGVAVCLKGNHEDKLLQFWEHASAGKLESWKSLSNAQTGMELLALPQDEALSLVQFIRRMPLFATYEDDNHLVVFAHADARSFQLGVTPANELLHGCSNRGRFDSDASMQRFLESVDIRTTYPAGCKPTKKQFFVRGHLPGTSWQRNVVSLEARAFQEGSLLAMRLDKFLVEGHHFLVPRQCGFNHAAAQEARTKAYKELQDLARDKLVVVKAEPQHGLRLFKYSRSVFYDQLWSKNEALMRARGHVYDVAGNLVSNPFDKVFNYLEEGAGSQLQAGSRVRAVEKLNGFLGVISPHPVVRNEVLVHTSGSFDSEFVGYIRDYLTPPVKGRMLRLFSKRRLTLMFEVLHPKDPHIIAYTPEQHGLYLIGAREIRQGAPLLLESELDQLAQELGVRRPWHFVTSFGELRKLAAACRHEGYMVRLCDEQETMVVKLKSPYYLTTKFLGRMGPGKWRHLFSNPKAFKANVDEEFYSLVDELAARYTLEDILALDEQGKLELVRSLVS